MKQKWINWFKHIQKSKFNPRCLEKSLYEYACTSIMQAHADTVRSFFTKEKNKMWCFLNNYDKTWHFVNYSDIIIDGVIYNIKDEHYYSPNIIDAYLPYNSRNVREIILFYNEEWKKDKEILDSLAIYDVPKLNFNDYYAGLTVDVATNWRGENTLTCNFHKIKSLVNLPKSLFYQSTPQSPIEVYDKRILLQLIEHIDILKSVFDLEIVHYDFCRVRKTLNLKVSSSTCEIEDIIEYGYNYLKNWRKYEIFNCGDTLILFNPSQRLMLEIDKSISYSDLAQYWNLLQETIKNPYFKYLYSCEVTEETK